MQVYNYEPFLKKFVCNSLHFIPQHLKSRQTKQMVTISKQ